jgi:hypothetical protein
VNILNHRYILDKYVRRRFIPPGFDDPVTELKKLKEQGKDLGLLEKKTYEKEKE